MLTMTSFNRRYTFIAIFSVSLMYTLVTTAAERPSDATISFWIAEAFSQDPRVITTTLDIRTVDGIVTLTGSVRSLAGKKYAGTAAQKINGVREVVNNLVVETVSRPDEEIRQDIQIRLGTGGMILSEGIVVTVVDGAVTLTGEVASWTERREAESRASEVRGVKDVRNDLKIITRAPRANDEIGLEVQTLLRGDIYLSGLPISVSVNNGVVILEGEVGNAYQRDRAGRMVRSVPSVRDVENKLTVQWWPEQSKRQPVPTPSVQELQNAVRRALTQDIRIDATRITVQVSQGLVTLHGSVSTYDQKAIVEQTTREVVGVAWVSNQLSVNAVPRNDSVIQADVRSLVDTDYLLNGRDIQIAVRDGLVTLSGTVNTLFEKTRAVDVISRVRGLRDLTNNLAVRVSPAYTDTILKDRIKGHLEANWATRWVADRMTVLVTNANVTLTGAVYTWGQRSEAGRVALLTEGVQGVDNRLTVAGAEYPWDRSHLEEQDH